MTLQQAKDQFSQTYLGKQGIHAVSAHAGKLRVYAERNDALSGIPNPFNGYDIELIISPRAKLAIR